MNEIEKMHIAHASCENTTTNNCELKHSHSFSLLNMVAILHLIDRGVKEIWGCWLPIIFLSFSVSFLPADECLVFCVLHKCCRFVRYRTENRLRLLCISMTHIVQLYIERANSSFENAVIDDDAPTNCNSVNTNSVFPMASTIRSVVHSYNTYTIACRNNHANFVSYLHICNQKW